MTLAKTNPLDIQIGGDHYKNFAIQPIEYIHQNNIGFIAGCVIKRIARYNQPTEKGTEDIRKIIHELDILIDQVNMGYPSYSSFIDRHSLPTTPANFCWVNGFEGEQAAIIHLVTLYNLSGSGVSDLQEAKHIAEKLLNEIS
jgi:hypothetical protein